MKYSMQIEKEIPSDLKERQLEIEQQLEESSIMIDAMKQEIQCDHAQITSDRELEEVRPQLLFIVSILNIVKISYCFKFEITMKF